MICKKGVCLAVMRKKDQCVNQSTTDHKPLFRYQNMVRGMEWCTGMQYHQIITLRVLVLLPSGGLGGVQLAKFEP